MARAIHHPSIESVDLATILRTIGDPVRLAMVRALLDGDELSCTALHEQLDIPVSTGSYHARLLREAGVTRTRADGTTRYISLRAEELNDHFPGLLATLAVGERVR